MYQNENESYDTSTDVYRSVVDKYTPLKSKNVGTYQAPIMKKELSICVMIRS